MAKRGVRSVGGSRQPLVDLDRTSPASVCSTTRQTGLAFRTPLICTNVQKASPSLGLHLLPYQFRHSGASMYRATKLRSLGEVKRRGGWNQHRSVAPYDKGSRLGFSAQEHATMLTVHDDECQKHLEGMLIYVRTGVKGGPGRALQLAGFPVRYWDSQFGRKGDITNLAVFRQVRKRHSSEQSCVCAHASSCGFQHCAQPCNCGSKYFTAVESHHLGQELGSEV